MSNLINPKPRFGYNPDTDMIYDYLAQRDVAPGDKPYDGVDGTWNMAQVKAAIIAGEPIESSHLTIKKIPPHAPIAQVMPGQPPGRPIPGTPAAAAANQPKGPGVGPIGVPNAPTQGNPSNPSNTPGGTGMGDATSRQPTSLRSGPGPFPTTEDVNRPAAPMTASQLQALNLTPVQLTALGITQAQLQTTGATAQQVNGWGVNAARADSLALTPAQRAVLLR